MGDQERNDRIVIPGAEEELAPELSDRYEDAGKNPRPDFWRTGMDDLTKLDIAPGRVWTPIGPSRMLNLARTDPRRGQGLPPVAGEVTDIAIDPTGAADTVIYAATNSGGIWKTADGGNSWNATSDGLPSLSMGAVAIDPGNSSIVYAGTGNLFDGSGTLSGFIKACGIYKSVDAGSTWFVADGGVFATAFAGFDEHANAFAIGITRILCTEPDRLLVGTANGLFRSIDGGRNFGANAPDFDNGQPMMHGFVMNLAMDTTDPAKAWVTIRGLDGSRNVFKDGGLFQLTIKPDGSFDQSGNLLSNPGPLVGVRFGSIAFAQTTTPNNQTLYVSVQTDSEPDKELKSSFVGLFVSANSGATWTRLPDLENKLRATPQGEQAEDAQSNYDLTLGVDPQNANLIYAGFKQIWISQNGGALFNPIKRGLVHLDQHELVFSPRTHWGAAGAPTTVYVGSDGGVSRSVNGGTNWTSLNTGAATQLFFGIDIGRGAANNQFTYGGTQDNGTSGHAPNITDWFAGIDGDGGIPAVDPANPKVVYGFDVNVLIKTTDGGLNWATSDDNGGVEITAISGTTPIQVTAKGHLFRTGDKITILNYQANPAINHQWTIHVADPVADPDHFTLDGSIGAGAFAANPDNSSIFAQGRRIGRGLANPADSLTRRVALVPNGVNVATTVYVSEDSTLRRSIDGGGLFDKLVRKFDADVSAIVCPDAVSIWVGTEDGQVHFSPDSGATWADSQPGDQRIVTGIAVDSEDAARVAVVYAGFCGINSKFRTRHCFLTTNAGKDWTDISGVDGRDTGNLPDLPLHSVVFDNSLAPLETSIVVSTDAAVLRTKGDFTTWQHAGAGLPRTTCRSLAIDNSGPNILRVGTYGRSCFELQRRSGPHLLVDSNLAFGGVLQNKTATLPVRLRNVGDAAVSLTSFSRTGGDADFDFATPPNLADLAPDEVRSFDIRFTAAGDGGRGATFTLQSNDADQPAREIAASGVTFGGGKPRLAVNANLNFGKIDRGASRAAAFTMANTGLADLQISKMELDGSGDFSMATPALPLTLAPGAQQTVNVTFTPGRFGSKSTSKLKIESKDPKPAQPIPVTGDSPSNIWLRLGVAALVVGVVVGGAVASYENRDKLLALLKQV